MDVDLLFAQLFPEGCTIAVEGDLLRGIAQVGGESVTVVGTANDAAIGVELALAMAVEVLATVQHHPRRAIVLLIDTQGQRLRHRDELLGINVYMAHLAQCLEVARRAGHRIVSLVYGRAVSGGYITGGMMADSCHALVSAEISVMNLPAMARVTKIPQERLEALAESSPVFAPGAVNYLKMGGLESLWGEDAAPALAAALQAKSPPDARGRTDLRRAAGDARGGRTMALPVSRRVLGDALD
jgi:malonate decarboxylase gamma subunit